MALAALILGIFSIALGLLPLLPLGGPALLTLAAVGLPLGIVAFGLGLVSRSGALRTQVDRQPPSRDGSRDRQPRSRDGSRDRQPQSQGGSRDRQPQSQGGSRDSQGRPGPAVVDLSLCTAALSAAVVGTLLCAAWIGAIAYMQHRVHQAAERCRRDPARCLRGSDDASDEGKPPAAPPAGRPAAPPARERDAGAGRTL